MTCPVSVDVLEILISKQPLGNPRVTYAANDKMVNQTILQYTGTDVKAFALIASKPRDLIILGVYWVRPWKPDIETRVMKTCCMMRGCVSVFVISERVI